jgi:RNA polymerase sigma factor (TIGR02999 family)
VTRILDRAAAGDQQAAGELLPLVYQQLRAAAGKQMTNERSGHTLQPTALVHEAFLKLVGERRTPWRSRRHFYAAAAEAMRQILLDHARARGRSKRGGDRQRQSLDFRNVADLANSGESEQVVALDEAIRRLETQRPRVARVVRLRFYAGLTVDETARALEVSPRTVDLDWAFARAWLFRELSEADDG